MTAETAPIPVLADDAVRGGSPSPSPSSRRHADAAPSTGADRIHWAGLVAMMLTSFVLVTAEFIPGGILPDIAADLGVTPGQAGQTVTVTALVGFLAAPTIGILTPGLDRRTLLVALAVAAGVSNLVVAIAPSLWLLLVARFLLGVAISGFWAMMLTVAAQLTGPERLGRGVMLVNAGTSLATVAGVPLAVALTALVDWRAVFVGAAALSVVVAVALRLLLPPVPPARSLSLRVLGETMLRPGVGMGLAGHVLTVLGHFTAFTFIRLALERVDGLDAGGAAILLVVFGVGGFAGNLVIGALVDRHLAVLRYLVPALLAVSVLVIALFPGVLPLIAVAVGVWGFAFGSWLVTVSTWSGRQMPDRLEAGGGLVVAGFQLAIALGAGVGGILVDVIGILPTLVIAATVLAVGGALFGAAGHRAPLPTAGVSADAPAGASAGASAAS